MCQAAAQYQQLLSPAGPLHSFLECPHPVAVAQCESPVEAALTVKQAIARHVCMLVHDGHVVSLAL